jgi:hypothetical protein
MQETRSCQIALLENNSNIAFILNTFKTPSRPMLVKKRLQCLDEYE